MDKQNLQVAVERVFGKRIVNRPGCEELSSSIYNKTKLLISYNTLRRFFGIAGQKIILPFQKLLWIYWQFIVIFNPILIFTYNKNPLTTSGGYINCNSLLFNKKNLQFNPLKTV